MPLRLFSNRSCTPTFPRLRAPCSVMFGPGELSQPEAVSDALTWTRVEKVEVATAAPRAVPTRPKLARLARTIAVAVVFFIIVFPKLRFGGC